MGNVAVNLFSRNEQTIIDGVPADKLKELVRLRTKDLSDLSESQKETIALLKEKLGINERQLRAAFGIVGEANVPPEQLTAKLAGIAEQIKVLRAENEQLRRGPPALAVIAEEVQALIDKGEFDDARRALARGREASRALRLDASPITRRGSWFRGRGSRICNSPTAPPPRNMPKRPASSRLSTQSCNGFA